MERTDTEIVDRESRNSVAAPRPPRPDVEIETFGSDRMRDPARRRPRVLLLAEAANPELVSVPLVGWSHAKAICEQVDGHVVTQVRNRDAIERAGWTHGVEFTAIDSERVAAPAYKLSKVLPGGWTTKMAITAITYRYFEHLLWKRFEADLASGRWDIVHRITPLSPTVPSIIGKRLSKLGIPFVIGPLNGGVPWPKEFDSARRAEREWLSYVRDVYKCLPGYRATRKYASTIICGSKATLEQMPQWCRNKCCYMPENAIDPARFSKRVEGLASSPLRVAFVGRLVPYKCPDILIEAAAPLAREGKVVLDIIGDGQLMPRLKSMVAELGIEREVRLDGWVQHELLPDRLVQSEVMGFPSIREFGGGVVLEAMALGLVPVVVDYGGPGELVGDGAGFKIRMAPRRKLIEEFRNRLEWLANNPARIRQISAAVQARVEQQFTWDAKARQVAAVYRNILQQA
jgi:glycosyltransferase involved in cell wall biosynthesis